MTKHPITPPSELVEQWVQNTRSHDSIGAFPEDFNNQIATQAARWGADQELEACLQWFSAFYCMETWMQKDLEKFREARRPKPPSLKERALEILNARFDALPPIDANIIRQALEQLDD